MNAFNDVISVVPPPLPVGIITPNVDASPLVNVRVCPLIDAVIKELAVIADVAKLPVSLSVIKLPVCAPKLDHFVSLDAVYEFNDVLVLLPVNAIKLFICSCCALFTTATLAELAYDAVALIKEFTLLSLDEVYALKEEVVTNPVPVTIESILLSNDALSVVYVS